MISAAEAGSRPDLKKTQRQMQEAHQMWLDAGGPDSPRGTLSNIARTLERKNVTIFRWCERCLWHLNYYKENKLPIPPELDPDVIPELDLDDPAKEFAANPFKLTEKQQRFCWHYLEHFDRTKAYSQAGYITTGIVGPSIAKLFKLVKIQKEINRLKKILASQQHVTLSKLIETNTEMVFTNIFDLVDLVPLTTGGYKVSVKEAAKNSPLINEIKVTEDGIMIKMPDKLAALKNLMKYLGVTKLEAEKLILDHRKLDIAGEKIDIDKVVHKIDDPYAGQEPITFVDDIIADDLIVPQIETQIEEAQIVTEAIVLEDKSKK